MRQHGEHHSDWTDQVQSRVAGDGYHAFLDAGFRKQLVALVSIFMIVIVVFAFMYLGMAYKCKLDLENSFLRAYMLSLETMVTIGFGVPDPYMNGCWHGAVLLTLQSLLQLLLVSFLIGMIFQRLSRPQSRACTILFSRSAVIQEIGGCQYFMFRICDLRVQHSLLEAHVRCYCGHKHPKRGYELVPLRLQTPDDELGASLLLNIPSLVVHRIDAWSPLAPQCKSDTAEAGDLRLIRGSGEGSHCCAMLLGLERCSVVLIARLATAKAVRARRAVRPSAPCEPCSCTVGTTLVVTS